MQKPHETVIVLGVSAGGMRALSTLLPRLPEDGRVPMVVVQHRAEEDDGFLLEHHSGHCAMAVIEVADKEPLRRGRVYLAPPGYHVLVESPSSLALSVEARVRGSRPSIDVLFESAAEVFGPRVVGVLLTGANQDGVRGLKRIKALGGVVLVQDPATADWSYMPAQAVQNVDVDAVAPLEVLAEVLRSIEQGLEPRKAISACRCGVPPDEP